MKLFEIKNRFTSSVVFSLETESLKLCVEAAVKDGADLRSADLAGAKLVGANLARAKLVGAKLVGASLAGASLARANLARADLGGANLVGASLVGANLVGANLVGANLVGASLARADLGGAKLMGDRPIIQIGPIGSRGDNLISYTTDQGLMIKTGCFFGTAEQFRAAITKKHGKNAHAEEYLAALALIETHARIFPATENK